jgi:hypothetical protein
VYIEGVREIGVYGVHNTSQVFENWRVAPLGHGPQPFGRIVNNTIHGKDGNEASFAGNPMVEPNDTIFNAIDTKQGRAGTPEVYSASGRIGDKPHLPQMASADVDMYRFQLDVGDQVIVNVTSNEFVPELRLFDSIGREFEANIADGAPFGAPRVTASGNTVRLQFYAEQGGTYFVSVSGTGHTDFSPLSMGSRSEATAAGNYTINLNVLAPRTWVIDTRMLYNQSRTVTVYDVDGVGHVRTTPVGATPQAITKGLRDLLNNIPGITAQAYGGYDIRGNAQREPSGNSTYTNRAITFPTHTNFERYVIVRGASKIEGLTPDILTPILGTNNDSGLLPETGILIGNEATPTVMNNVLSNFRNAIVETPNQPNNDLRNSPTFWIVSPRGAGPTPDTYTYPGSYTLSPLSSVVGANLFQHNQHRQLTSNGVQMVAGNWGVSDVRVERAGTPVRMLTEHVIARTDNQDFNIALAGAAPLFVNAADRNYFPAPLSRAIDSGLSSLEDRPAFLLVKRPMGLADSPVLAPIRDAVGQLRIDDPAVAPPQGQGQNVFIDRGSLDRSDFIGPSTRLVFPRDNDLKGLDIDPAVTVVQLLDGVYPQFSIQLVDGFELADPFPGVGVNAATVQGPRGPEARLPGSAITVFQNGVFLEEERDYSFRYDPISNTIHLLPSSGIWRDDAVYHIELNNRDRFVINAPRGDQVQDGERFQITDGSGTTVTFEFDTGFYFDIPQSLSIQVPRTGTTDGQRFHIRDASNALNRPVTFEIVFDGREPDDDNHPVRVATGFTPDQIAQAIVDAIHSLDESLGLELNPRAVGDGTVHLGAGPGITVNTDQSTLTVSPTILTLAIPVTADAQGNPRPAVVDGQTFAITVGNNAPVTFEFDNNRFWTADHRINVTNLTTVDQVGMAVAETLLAASLDLTGVRYAGNGLVHVNIGGNASIDPMDSNVFSAYLARPLVDGERFTIEYDHDQNPGTPPIQRTFEFVADGSAEPDTHVAIPFSLNDTHEDIAVRTAEAVFRATELQLPDAKHLTNGRVYLGGTTQHEVDLTEAPTISPTGRPLGRPEVAPSSRLLLPGYLSILVPETGGQTIFNRSTFTITDQRLPAAQRTATFEFALTTATPGFYGVPYAGTNAHQLADNIIAAINAAKSALSAQGFLAGVTPTKVVDDDGQIVVELTGTTGFHALNTAGAPNVDQRGGRIGDSTFVLSYEGNRVTFEFDSNQQFVPGNIVIPYTQSTSLDEIANRVITAIRNNPVLNLPNAVHLGKGVIELHDSSRHQPPQVDSRTLPPDDQVRTTGIPGGAVRLAFEPWDQFTGAQFAQNIIQAINSNPAFNGVTASMRGGNTLFVDFRDPVTNLPANYTMGPATISGISNYFLRAIQDIPGNWLKPNQFTDKTTFTILLPGVQLDFGDAPDSLESPRYPTLFANNGARHVISDSGLFLGSRVDGDRDGQPRPAGLGDDLDHMIDLSTTPIALTGLAPYVLRIPAAGVADGATFTIVAEGVNPVVFEFVDMMISDNEAEPGREPVNFSSATPAEQRVLEIAGAIREAIQRRAELGLTPVILEGGELVLGASFMHRIDTRGTSLSTSGQPAILLRAVAGDDLRDGQRFTVSDGRNAPVIFEFDNDGSVPLGVRAVPFASGDSAADIAAAILDAVNAARQPGVGLLDAEFVMSDLGNGRLHVSGIPSHRVDLANSGLVFSGHTPAELVTPGIGLGLRLATPLTILLDNATGGGVVAGQTFTIQDGNQLPVTFEFATNGPSAVGYLPVAYNQFFSATQIAANVAAAIEAAVASGRLTGLDPQVAQPAQAGDPLEIHLNPGVYHRLDTSTSGLGQRGAVRAGETFMVVDGSGGWQVFEFVRSIGEEGIGRVPVVFQDSFNANDLANAIVAAVQARVNLGALGSDIVPKNYANGDIQIGGGGAIMNITAPSLTAKGEAGGILDGQVFTINDGVNVRQFEFDADRKSVPGNVIISINLDDDPTAVAEKLLARLEQTGYQLELVSLGNGVMRLEGNDDDGIFVDGVPTPGSTVTLLVTASAPGFLDGWIDFNNDGDFLDQFEHVYASQPLKAGINELTLNVPINAFVGPLFARFRFSSQGGLAPTGLAVDGEVEDHIIEIFSNQPPVLTVPGPLVVQEDVPSPIAGISVFDADAGSLPIAVTLTVLNGTLTVNTSVANGLVPADIQGNGTGRIVLTGTQIQISNTLAHASGLIYQTVLNFNGEDLLTVVADDLGNFGTGGARQDLRTVPLTVLPVNDPPTVMVPGTQFVDEDSVLIFAPGSIGVFDVEHDRGEVPADTAYELTLTVSNGSLVIRNDVAGGILADEIQGNGTRTVVVLAPLDRMNATFASSSNLTYTPDPDFDDRDVLTLILNDLGSFGAGGPQQDTQTVAIEIRAINDAPVVTVPGNLTVNENTAWNMAGFNVWDVDSRGTPIVVTLMVSGRSDGQSPSGTLRFVDTSALDFAAGDILNPSQGSVITIEAPVARISALLSDPAAWQYVPPPNFGGDVDSSDPADWAYEIVTILAEDRGATGDEVPPEPKSDTQSLTIFLREVNDPPQITAPATAVVDEDQWLNFTGPRAVSIADPDLGSGQMAVTVTATSGTVAMGAAPPAISLSLLGSLTDINAALATLRFQGNLNYEFHGPASVVIHADDQGNTPPPAQQTTHTVAITVNPVNDPPVITMPGPLSVLENRSLSIPNVSVTDVDAFEGGSDGVLTVKLSVAAMTALESGTLNVAANVPGGLPSSAIGTLTTAWSGLRPALPRKSA